MRKFGYKLGLVGGLVAPAAAMATDDVWTSATTAIGTATTNVTALMIAVVAISFIWLGAALVQKGVGKAKRG